MGSRGSVTAKDILNLCYFKSYVPAPQTETTFRVDTLYPDIQNLPFGTTIRRTYRDWSAWPTIPEWILRRYPD